MATQAVQEKKGDLATFNQKMNDFLYRNRMILISCFVVVFCVIAALVTVSAINGSRNRAAFERVDAIVSEWDAARNESDTAGLAGKETGYIEQLSKIARANGNTYAAARADLSAAEIYYARKDWKNARELYLAAAARAPKAYTAGICWYNAGMCADELGNAQEAIDSFTKAAGFGNFGLKSRALFNIGRVEEQRGGKDAAIAAYESLVAQFPDDQWSLLAKSRVIALQIQ